MGQQIVKQPDGLYAVWSSVVDSFISVNNTPAEIVEALVADERERIQNRVNHVISQLDKGETPYHQFTMTFDECVALMRDLHGDESTEVILKMMEPV